MLTNRILNARLADVPVILSILLATVSLSTANAQMDPNASTATALTSQVFRFNNATPSQAAAWLKKMSLGETVSEISSAKALVVTCRPADLPKVRIMLKYIDAMPDVTVKVLGAFSAADTSSDKILQKRVGQDLVIGTFADPPTIGPGGVIVDEHDGKVIAIGARADVQKLIEAIGQQPSVPQQDTVSQQAPAVAVDASEDKLFEKLIDVLSREEGAARAAEAEGSPEAKAGPSRAVAETNVAPGISEERLAEMIRRVVREETDRARTSEISGAISPTAPEAEQPETAEANQPAPTHTQFNLSAADLELELQLPERLEIIDLLDLLGKYLRLNYMFDENILKGQYVNLRVQGKIKVRDLYAIAENVLRFRGLVMTRSNDLVTIIQMGSNVPSQNTFVTGVEGVRPGDAVVTRIFQLKYATTTSVRTLLTSLKFANNGQNISEIPETGTLVITDYSLAMPKIEELLAVVDRPGEDRTFKFVKLRYTMAKNLAPKLKDLAEQLGAVSVSMSSAVTTPTTPTPTRPGVPRTPIPRPTVVTAQTAAKPGVYLDYDERTNRLLIVGRPEEIDLIEQLISDLDVAQQDLRTLKQYTIQNVDTSEVLTTLKELGIIQETPETTTRTTAAAVRTRGATPATPTPSPAEPTTTGILGAGPVVEPPMISVLAATNSLLVNATAEQHAAISLVIAYVDAERSESSINYVVYPLENQDPVELKGVLESLITGRAAVSDTERKVERPTITRPGQPGQPVTTAPIAGPAAEAAEQEITIVADPTTYSLLVYASKKNQQWISSVIKELDRYRPQVLLDVTLVEISRDDSFQYDLKMITKVGSFHTPQGLERLTASGFGNFTHDPITEGTSLGGTGTAFYGDDHIQALFTAMQQKKYGRVMSRPQILVNDNQEGTIKAEDKVYIPAQKTTYVSTSGTEGIISQPIQEVTFDAYPAGITLTITPHISEGDNLRLKILLDRTDQGDPKTVNVQGVTYTSPPDSSTNNLTSVVTVPDNSTIILGGLERLDQSKGGTKVPVLGDIPLVGGLFRSTNNKDSQRKLYVFIKAHILRPGEDAGSGAVKRVSRPKIESFEELEREMQKYQDWPGLDAQPMQPRKVLEEN